MIVNMKPVINDQLGYLFFIVIVGVSAILIFYDCEILKRILKLLIGIAALYFAILAYNKFDTFSIYNIVDRCIAWETQVNYDNTRGVVIPVFVNQGGDAFAYMDLVKKYEKMNKDETKGILKNQLIRIFENIETTGDNYLSYASVHLDKNFDENDILGVWDKIDLGNREVKIQTEKLFWPKSIVEQLNHRVYWMTKAQCAKILRQKESFLNFKKDKIKKKKLLSDFNFKEMFNNLVSLIESDYSMVVRKEALQTYLYWVCPENGQNKECKEGLIKNKIYYFHKIKEHWGINQDGILKKLNENIFN